MNKTAARKGGRFDIGRFAINWRGFVNSRAIGVLSLALSLGCASRGSPAPEFSSSIGTATEAEIFEMAHRVLALHQFEIEREQGSPSIYIETRWRDRTPFFDEAVLAIEDAQIRAIVRARPRGNTSVLGVLYTVDMAVEQRVRVMGSDAWVHMKPTPASAEYAARIIEDVKRQLEIGVRRFGRDSAAPSP